MTRPLSRITKTETLNMRLMATRSFARSLSTDPMIQKTNEPNQAKAKQIFPQNKHIRSATDKRVKLKFGVFRNSVYVRRQERKQSILKYPIHNNEPKWRLLLSAKRNLARSNRLTNEEVLQYLQSAFRVQFLKDVYNKATTIPQATTK